MTNLHALADSALIQRLGWALVHSIWQASAIAIFLAICLPAFRRRGARAAYAACCAALLLAGVAPVMTFALLPHRAEPRAASAAAEQELAARAPGAATATFVDFHALRPGPDTDAVEADRTADAGSDRGPVQYREAATFPTAAPAPVPLGDRAMQLVRTLGEWLSPWLPSIVLIWSLGVLALSLRNAGGWLAAQRLKSEATNSVPVAIEAAAARLARSLGLAHSVRLLQSALVDSPLVIGALRPVILLPASLVTGLPADQLESLLAHELAHVSRHDYLVNLLQSAMETLFFYHPAVWWISSRVRTEREHCCDDIAVRLVSDRQVYVRALAAVAGARVPAMTPAAGGGLLLSRLRRVLGMADAESANSSRWLAGAALLALCGGVVIFAALHVRPAKGQTKAEPAEAQAGERDADPSTKTDGPPSTSGHLTVAGTISMPDGSPATEATVSSIAEPGGAERTTVQTNRLGRFELTGEFFRACMLHASSADGTFQRTWRVPGLLARTRLAKPVDLKLLPAREIIVSVSSAGEPVEGAQLVANGFGYWLPAVTGADGSAHIRLPPDARLWSLMAWHPTLGATARFANENGLTSSAFQLSLLDPMLRTVHVTDIDGNSIPDLKLALHVRVAPGEPEGWLETEKIERAHITTDEHGEAKVTWFPKENAKNFDATIISADWTLAPPSDEYGEPEEVPREGPIEVRVRRRPLRIDVPGRVKLPNGAKAAGILVDGLGGRARTRADGSFSVPLVAGRAHSLDIADLVWASDGWTGVIRTPDGAAPAEVILEAYPATPLEIRVSRGPDRRSLPRTWLRLNTQRKFTWRDDQGKKQDRDLGLFNHWLRTDDDDAGVVRIGVGKGKHKIGMGAPNWHEERIVEVADDSPKVVEFHRRWSGARKIVGRLLQNDLPYKPSSAAVVRAEAKNGSERWRPTLAVESQIRADGTVVLEADAEQFLLLVTDPKERLSGYVRLGAASDAVDVPLSPAATFAGTVVDGREEPLAGATLKLVVRDTGLVAGEEQSDDLGRFRFNTVPANAPLAFQIRRQPDGPVVAFYYPRLFLPGEMRDDVPVVVESDKSSTEQADRESISTPSLADRLARATRTVRAAGMRLLVVLQGDDSARVANLTDEILDDRWRDDEPQPILGYLPLVVGAMSIESESAMIKQLGWRRPATGEVVLIVVDGSGDQIATGRIAAGDRAAAEQAAQFVEQNQTPIHDAKELLDAAQKNASRSGRRVWIVLSGPRCGPCFSLARWMDDQHELLEKDYVIVKSFGLDEHSEEVANVLKPPDNWGIPWFAIAEPDGTVIVTSDGPLGNVGFPASKEGMRHLRDMLGRTARRLTTDELDRLAQSVSEVDP